MHQHNCGYASYAFRLQKPLTKPAKKRLRDMDGDQLRVLHLPDGVFFLYVPKSCSGEESMPGSTLFYLVQALATSHQPRDVLDGCTYTLWPHVSRWKVLDGPKQDLQGRISVEWREGKKSADGSNTVVLSSVLTIGILQAHCSVHCQCSSYQVFSAQQSAT